MPAFRFRLQTVLDRRVQARNSAEAALIEKRLILATERCKLKNLIEQEQSIGLQIAEVRRKFMVRAQSKSTPIDCLAGYLCGLQQDLSDTRDAVRQQHKAVEDAQTQMREAESYLAKCSRGAETLKRYRERLWDQFVRTLAQKETIDEDESAIVAHLKRSRGL